MSTESAVSISELLADGWVVVGYATTMMAAGAMTHSVLLQRETELQSITVVISKQGEVGRTVTDLSSAPKPAKVGWF